MKLAALTLLTLAPAFSFAAPSATLGSTQYLKLTIENQTDLTFDQVTLTPHLSCSTTNPEGGGEASTESDEATLEFRSDVSGLQSSVLEANLQIVKGGSAVVPKKRSVLFSRSGCGAGVVMNLKVTGETYYQSPSGQESVDYIVGALAKVSSKSSNADLTASFSAGLEGQYLLKLVNGGEAFDAKLGHRVPVCRLGLFKKSSKGLLELGRAMSYEKKNCSVK